jgi:hypothetical protein
LGGRPEAVPGAGRRGRTRWPERWSAHTLPGRGDGQRTRSPIVCACFALTRAGAHVVPSLRACPRCGEGEIAHCRIVCAGRRTPATTPGRTPATASGGRSGDRGWPNTTTASGQAPATVAGGRSATGACRTPATGAGRGVGDRHRGSPEDRDAVRRRPDSLEFRHVVDLGGGLFPGREHVEGSTARSVSAGPSTPGPPATRPGPRTGAPYGDARPAGRPAPISIPITGRHCGEAATPDTGITNADAMKHVRKGGCGHARAGERGRADAGGCWGWLSSLRGGVRRARPCGSAGAGPPRTDPCRGCGVGR